MAASTALAVVGAALAWWLPGAGPMHTLGLALVVLGPLTLLATLTLVDPVEVSEVERELTATTPPAPTSIERDADVASDDGVDERLPELELEHSVRP